MSRQSFSKDVHVIVRGVPFKLNRDLVSARSSKLCKLFKENPDKNLAHLLCDIPTTPPIFEIMVKFCYGFKVNFTPENVIPIACLACYLGMTDSHSPHNLLNQSLYFFEHKVITGWNESLSSLMATKNPVIFQQAIKLGLVDACMDSIIKKALDNPLLLGKPIKNHVLDDGDQGYNGHFHKPNAKSQLFVLEWKSKDLSLTTLDLQFYKPIIHKMIKCKLGSNYIASNLYQYTKRWVFLEPQETNSSNSKRLAIEEIERLLPNDRGILPCALLSKMLRYATVLEANVSCREGFEARIGRQLDSATVSDLLIPTQGYVNGEKYDTECVRRILKHFYNGFDGHDQTGLDIVGALVEYLLHEVANDNELRKDSFISLAEMSVAASAGARRTLDGVYEAIDVYLNKHKHLTESEREEICAVLDCNKMSPEACEHGAQNERLPVRVAVQMLFARQLHLRETVAKEVVVVGPEEDGSGKSKSREDDEEVKWELEKMNSKVVELEKECVVMRKKIEKSYLKKEKLNVDFWGEMKRKLGCISSLNNTNCHVNVKKKKMMKLDAR
ncbi:putative BTB/POZ domain, NPH3 domain, NPH3/RPT2-like family protein [Helianthus annuus]|nr:putative BTB/POZ domain, NPH3 domain, NPH3/RPT2-like family protein [Helianthus annuus]